MESLETKVASWLKEQGYPLEMEIAWKAKSVGFDVSQSDYYFDPETDEPREIDLILRMNKYLKRFNMEYTIFVECKSSKKEKPWLLFSTKNDLIGAVGDEKSGIRAFTLQHALLANDLGDDLLLRSVFNGNLGNIYPRLDTEPTLAYGVAQAFSNENSDAPFKALMGVTKATLSHVKRRDVFGLSIPFSFAIPVIVTDVPILSVVYRPDKPDLDIKEVKRGMLLWKHVVAKRSNIGVYIIHSSEIEDFLKDCIKSANWWMSIDEETLDTIYHERYEKNKT